MPSYSYCETLLSVLLEWRDVKTVTCHTSASWKKNMYWVSSTLRINFRCIRCINAGGCGRFAEGFGRLNVQWWCAINNSITTYLPLQQQQQQKQHWLSSNRHRFCRDFLFFLSVRSLLFEIFFSRLFPASYSPFSFRKLHFCLELLICICISRLFPNLISLWISFISYNIRLPRHCHKHDCLCASHDRYKCFNCSFATNAIFKPGGVFSIQNFSLCILKVDVYTPICCMIITDLVSDQ